MGTVLLAGRRLAVRRGRDFRKVRRAQISRVTEPGLNHIYILHIRMEEREKGN